MGLVVMAVGLMGVMGVELGLYLTMISTPIYLGIINN